MKIIFLGIAERAAAARDGGTPLLKWNILGLKNTWLTYFVPLSFRNLKFVFACTELTGSESFKIKITHEKGQTIGWFTFSTSVSTREEPITDSGSVPMVLLPRGWAITVLQPNADIIAGLPGRYLLSVEEGEGEQVNQVIGEFACNIVNPAPLTPERIAAIKTDPQASKIVRIELGCKECATKIRAYAALGEDLEQESEGYAWYRKLPDQARCECGLNEFNLTSLKRNLFGHLGRPVPVGDEEIDYVPLYEKSILETLRFEFLRLLDQNPAEERLQKFIEQNPILLHQFPAEKLFFKPPILTFFKADFAILTSRKELLLIEIETTKTPLLKKDGGRAAALTHAFDQVQSWLHTVDEHRLAVLDSLKINRDQVSAIKAIVIAGRDAGYDAEHLRRLRGVDHGRVSFLTFDDLAYGLGALIRPMSRL